jgi:predicted dehydrogenase
MNSNLHSGFNRREFLRRAALAAAATACIAPWTTRLRAAAKDTLLHAAVGVGGQGASDLEFFTNFKYVKLVAVADVEAEKAERWKKQFPDLRVYTDWRQLLEKEPQLDSLNVATPDHMHAPIAMSAMQRGLAVYCQKPMTHDVAEARALQRYAAERKLVTQMGIQIHSSSEYRTAVQLVHSGVIGKIKEVHAWSNKKWGDMSPRPDRNDPVPAGLAWNDWLGVCAERPFIGGGYYHPGNWRKRLDFGTGTFGDMGCHIYDPMFKAVGLTSPLSLKSLGPEPNAWNWAINARIEYVFPRTPYTADDTVKVTWYDGDQKPPQQVLALLEGDEAPGQGSILIGTEGVMCIPHIAQPKLYPKAKYADRTLERVRGVNHYEQWLEAVRGSGKCSADFDYAGPLTETVLLGGVATRFKDQLLELDTKALRFKGPDAANALLKRAYRQGWEVKGLG